MTGGPAEDPTLQLLERLRRAEKEQALFYRAMASVAEATNHPAAHRFHDLHADEQHHLSRLTARVLEAGGRPVDLSSVKVEGVGLERYESEIQAREALEIGRYREALDRTDLDEVTRSLLAQILEVEEHHAADLGGKWTMA